MRASSRIAALVAVALAALIAIPCAAVIVLDRLAHDARDRAGDEVAAATRRAVWAAQDAPTFAAIAHDTDVQLWLVDPRAHRVLVASDQPALRSDLGTSSFGIDPAVVEDATADRPPPAEREIVALAVSHGSARGCAILGDGDVLACEAAERGPFGRVVLGERIAPRVTTRLLDARTGLFWLLAAAVVTAIALAVWLARRLVRPLGELASQVRARAARDRDRIAIAGAPREIDEVARAVDRLVTQLDGERRRQADSAADLAHAIKGALARIRLALEHGGEAPAVAEPARAAARDIDRTIGELLAIARAEAGLAEEPRAEVELRTLCERVAAGRGKPVAVTGEHVTAKIAEPAVTRALAALLDNAEAFARERIAIEVRARDGRAEIAVRDDGPGVPEDLRPRLFARFASRRPGGTGLGLAYVRAVAEAHGGSATLEPGDGACFVMRLTPVHTPSTHVS